MTVVARAAHAVFAAVLVLGLCVGGLATAGSAWAHATLIASDPAADTELPGPPPSVSATFNEAMQAQFAAMTVIGPDGDQWSDGAPMVDGAVIRVAVRGGGPAGTYTVNYRATSADGHVVTGSWTYMVLAPGAPSETPTAPTASATSAPEAAPAATREADGPPAWPFVAAGTAIVAAGALWAVRRRS